ncbi:MAG: 3-hydroxy-3-methylglutaryl-CoA reductase, partial [Thermoplasmata archaeon]|nr:3-hydroxy-3-methylglutaryl-CoA reductase [Thermoplasmata archaeon]
ILLAYALADADPYRCSTHNKGVMNGISAVVRASGNDTRAVEAGAHSYAARDGRYRSITKYFKNEEGDLIGEIELPMAVGLVGGATKVHPAAKACVKILDVKTAAELGEIIAAVGLAQNIAALRALTSEGIQKGHMGLHARNIAVQAGAKGDEVDRVATRLAKTGKVREDLARQILEEIRKK